jgi:hypothetical protein
MNCPHCCADVEPPDAPVCPACAGDLAGLLEQPAPALPQPTPSILLPTIIAAAAFVVGLAILGAIHWRGPAIGPPSLPAAPAAASNSGAQVPPVVNVNVKGLGERQAPVVDGVAYFILKTAARPAIGSAALSFSAANAPSQTPPASSFLVIQVAASNLQRIAQTVNPSQMTLEDNAGNQYQTSSDGEAAIASLGDKTALTAPGNLGPAAGGIFSLVYEIPGSAQGLTLRIGSATGGGTAVLDVRP